MDASIPRKRFPRLIFSPGPRILSSGASPSAPSHPDTSYHCPAAPVPLRR
jgi:hypothetical protein